MSADTHTFSYQETLNHVPNLTGDLERATRYLERHAPDLLKMVLG